MDDVETTVVSLAVSNDTNTTHVATTSDHSNHTGIELDVVCNLAGSKVDLDGVIDLDDGIWVSDSICPSACGIFFQPNIGSTSD